MKQPTNSQINSRPWLNTSLKALSMAVMAVSMTQLGYADTQNKQIGDLEIYKAPEGGSVTLTLMLDTSGSMGVSSIAEDYPDSGCSASNAVTEQVSVPMTDSTGVAITDSAGKALSANFDITGCSKTKIVQETVTKTRRVAKLIKGRWVYVDEQYQEVVNKEVKLPLIDGDLDRISRLKIALISLMADGKKLPNTVKMGVGNFSSYGDNKTGMIKVPAKPLDSVQRQAIIDYAKSLQAISGTPSALAYAEAGAYMMGTSTATVSDSSSTRNIPRGYARYSNSYWYLYPCIDFNYSSGGYSCSTNGYSAYAPYSNSNNYGLGTISSSTFNLASIGNPTKMVPVQQAGVSIPTLNWYINEVTTKWPNTNYSGMGYSDNTTKIATLTKYQSPIVAGQCDGYGIYFLTDGEPNGSDATETAKGMAASLGQTNFSSSNDLPTTGTAYDNSGWEYIGAYAKALRNTSNPIKQEIKTAALGLGTVFTSGADPITGKVADCSKLTKQDAKNLCNLGQNPALGSGGFTATSKTEIIGQSIIDFATILKKDLPPAPSGIIVVPDDPYRADSQLAYAYYPTIQADLQNNVAFWVGNMKKYKLNEGTLYGSNNQKLFKDVGGTLDSTTPDLWTTATSGDFNDVKVGGFYEKLPSPALPTDNPTKVRKLYIEDGGTLKSLAVNASGKVTLNGLLLADTKFTDAIYTDDVLRRLIKFLGFTNFNETQAVKDLVIPEQTTSIKVLGATPHSTPSSISYTAALDVNGRVSDQRDDYVLFGSSDGALHLVNADDGQESFAFIPQQMLIKQPKALVGQQGTGNGVGQPYFGVDAPWLVHANYYYDVANKKVTVERCPADSTNPKDNERECRNTQVRAYGGFRLGGDGMYGLDLIDKTNPKLLFKLDASKTGFERMGQIWSKPTRAKIATSYDSSTKKVTSQDILVFGGGYDTCYEDENYQVGTTTSTLSNQKSQACNRTTDTNAIGNAVYIVNADTGALIWSATYDSTASGATEGKKYLTNSIVGGVTVLDRDNDGFMDHLYFADLGGQVFRADFTNAGFVKPTTGTPTPETRFGNARVVRILQPAFSGTEVKYTHRFYERPVVSFYRGDSTFNDSRLYAVVNVASGDRSSPLSTIRSDNKYADRLYGIFDTDITLADDLLYASDFESKKVGETLVQKVKNLTATTEATSDLVKLPIATSTTAAAAKVANEDSIQQVKTKRGWYYPLTRFDGYDNVKYTKAVGRAEVIDGFLYTTLYNPDMNYSDPKSCAAKVAGGSERQLYCLPYGVCPNPKSYNGTAGFMRAGQGIQELTLGPRSSSKANQRLLIGTRTLQERLNNRVDFGNDNDKLLSGDKVGEATNNIGLDKTKQPLGANDKTTGDGSAPDLLFNERYTFQPRVWYEVAK